MTLQGFLNKSLTKCVFGQNASLNVKSTDLGENSITMSTNSEAAERLPTAVNEAISLNFYRSVSLTISINKLSQAYHIYSDLIESGVSYIGGNCVFTDDVGREYAIESLSIEMGENTGDGKNASVDFILKGIQRTNQGAFEV